MELATRRVRAPDRFEERLPPLHHITVCHCDLSLASFRRGIVDLKDPVVGSRPIDILARVAARIAEPDRAIAALEKVLSIPGQGALAENVPLTPALFRLDPMFDPLRGNPRFEKLAHLDGK